MLLKKRKNLTHYTAASQKNVFVRMSSQLSDSSFDNSYFQHYLPQIYRSILKSFKRILQAPVLLNLFFFLMLVIEFSAYLMFTIRSVIAALMLGVFFLTCFSYVVLRFYYQTKKNEQLLRLKEQLLCTCRRHVSAPAGEPTHHLSIAEALIKFSSYLMSFEENFYKIPSWMKLMNSLFCRISSMFYWKDVFAMRELLLQAAVGEHLKQIRAMPTDLEVHASLASVYVAQSLLYKETMTTCKSKKAMVFEESFRMAAHFANEEFKILSQYAPNDPWVHEQLAKGYCQLDMPREELAEVEMLRRLRPQDKEILFHLGLLYFRQGLNAKGLQIYEELKQSHFKKAEELIASYGVYKATVSA